jgi:hypothetical protein
VLRLEKKILYLSFQFFSFCGSKDSRFYEKAKINFVSQTKGIVVFRSKKICAGHCRNDDENSESNDLDTFERESITSSKITSSKVLITSLV